MRRTLIVLVAAACLIGTAFARHGHHHHAVQASATAGDFDYYLLALSWSPAFCLQKPDSPECNGTRRYGFIVHGLWPQNEVGWPEHCAGNDTIPDAVVRAVSDVMPARSLILHEWSTHGTCSGLDPAAYFSLIHRAFDAIAIPESFMRASAPIERPTAEILSDFLRANPALSAQSLSVTCTTQGAPRLREVHVCLDTRLAPRACSADALRGACRAASVLVPPIR